MYQRLTSFFVDTLRDIAVATDNFADEVLQRMFTRNFQALGEDKLAVHVVRRRRLVCALHRRVRPSEAARLAREGDAPPRVHRDLDNEGPRFGGQRRYSFIHAAGLRQI